MGFMTDNLSCTHKEQDGTNKCCSNRNHRRHMTATTKHAAKRKEMEALLLSEMKRLHDPHRLWDQK